MAGMTYKCPSCGAYLTFDPEGQQWKCPFCDSAFQEDALLETEAQHEQDASEPETYHTAEGEQVLYRCQSCGSEIVTTDETTVATECYYCHSPVVLQGRLPDEFRPDTVLPFTIDQDAAVKGFMNWVKSKKYVPKAFFSQSQIQKISGVYYPHFVTECEVEGAVEGEGRNTSVMDMGKYIVTSTQHYHVRREADITFGNIMRPALAKQNRKLADGIHPFPLENEKPFSTAYLSGFLAERRDIDPESIQGDIQNEVEKYVEPLLNESIHYNSYSVSPSAKLKKMNTRYVLLPTWVLTYPNKHKKDDPYYYAMNGCTGEVCGKLPIDKKKLNLNGLFIGAAVFAVGCLISYFLF